MENNNQWAKACLVAYKFLPRFCKILDKRIQEIGYGSNCISSSMIGHLDIETIAEKIIALSAKKVDYINLKLITERALGKMNKKLSKILILKYIYHMKSVDICNLLKMNIRTYFRKVNDAVEEFASKLVQQGYKRTAFMDLIKDDKFISNVYCLVKQNDDFSIETFKLKVLNLKFAF